jgi:hypothetical protein
MRTCPQIKAEGVMEARDFEVVLASLRRAITDRRTDKYSAICEVTRIAELIAQYLPLTTELERSLVAARIHALSGKPLRAITSIE